MNPSRVFDFDALRAHEPFARRLARSLLRDPAAAEDAVQDAWLRAMDTPPRPEGNLRSWFLEVTRNVVRQALRRDSRRQRRERTWVDAGALPSPDEVIERERTRRRLLEALFALEEPYRSTLIWTYLEDLSAAELARRLDIPASTVRNRVKRGLERLRQDLEGIDPNADWRVPIVAWLRIAPGGTSGAGVAAQATSNSWVGAALLREAALVAVVVSGLAVAWWTRSPSDSPSFPGQSVARGTVEPTAQDLGAAEVPLRTTALSDALPRAEWAVAGAAEVERWYGGVHGILRRSDGSPAAGAEVAVIASDPAARSGVALCRRVAVVREDGAFEIGGVPPTPRLSLVIGIGEGACARTLIRAPHYGERLDLGVLEMPVLGSVRGRVVDDDGSPLAGAEVRAIRFDGHARALEELASHVRFDLLRSGVRFVTKRDGSSDEPHYEAIEPPSTLLAALRGIGIPCVRTDEAGRFELRGIDRSASQIVVSAPDRFGAMCIGASTAAGECVDLGDLVVTRSRSIRGRVLDSNGDPVANAEVLVGPTAFEGEIHALVPTSRSDATGAFEAAGLPERLVLVAARRDERDPFTILAPHAVDASHVVTLPESSPLELRLESRERSAVDCTHARISLFAGTTARTFAREWASEICSEFRVVDMGCVSSRPLPHGEYTVRIEVPGFAPVERSVSHDEGSENRIALEPGHALALAIEDSTGAAVAGALVRLTACLAAVPPPPPSPLPIRSPGFPREAQAVAFSSERGDVLLRDLPAGEYELFVDHPELGRSFERVVVPHDRLTVALVPHPVVRGQILADGLVPSRPRCVRLEARKLLDGRRELVLTTQTDGAGRFEFRGVPPGIHRLSSREPDGSAAPLSALASLLCPNLSATSTTTEIDVPTTGERFVWHEESPNHAAPSQRALEVVGTVRWNGEPAVGMRIDVLTNTGPLGAEPIAARSAITSATGDFRITALAPPRAADRAACFMLFDRAGRLMSSRPNVVLTDDVTRVDLVLELGNVRGCVRGPHGEPIECAVSFAGGGDGFSTTRQVATAADGTYALADLPRGDYTVRISVGESCRIRQEVRIVVGDNRFDIRLLPPDPELPASSLPENPSARTGQVPSRRGDIDR